MLTALDSEGDLDSVEELEQKFRTTDAQLEKVQKIQESGKLWYR